MDLWKHRRVRSQLLFNLFSSGVSSSFSLTFAFLSFFLSFCFYFETENFKRDQLSAAEDQEISLRIVAGHAHAYKSYNYIRKWTQNHSALTSASSGITSGFPVFQDNFLRKPLKREEFFLTLNFEFTTFSPSQFCYFTLILKDRHG